MDVERIIDKIQQLEEMFEAADSRPFSATDISAANRRRDEMNAHSPWFKLRQHYGVCCRSEPPVLRLGELRDLALKATPRPRILCRTIFGTSHAENQSAKPLYRDYERN